MDRDYGVAHYTTQFFEDAKAGCAGMELYRATGGITERVARVIFWDASGQFFIETFNSDLPLTLAEELISEAKASVRVN